MWIGYAHVDRLVTYPEAIDLSASGRPIRNANAIAIADVGASSNTEARQLPLRTG